MGWGPARSKAGLARIPAAYRRFGLAVPDRYRRFVPYRLVYAGLGLLAVAFVALGVAFAREGESIEVPAPLESVSPEPGATTIRQAVVEVDLEIGYEADIFVNGFEVPDATFVSAIGMYRWSPSPTSVIMESWTPGEHTVRVEWRRITGTPDFGSFEWSFRVQ